MTDKRIYEILKDKDIKDIYYNEKPVWIQEINGEKATVGFMDSNNSRDIYISDLYEKNLFN